MKKVLHCLLAVMIMFGCIQSAPINAEGADEIKITEASGCLESAYAEWQPIGEADGYNVYYSQAGSESYIKADDELVRVYSDFMRADILGLSAGDYILKIVPVSGGTELTDKAEATQILSVKGYTREGFAFSAKSPYGTTNGGYNSDGTIKNTAETVYVTDWNKDCVTVGGDSSKGVGITDILNIRDKNKSETPMVIRFIGKVTMPKNVENYMLKIGNTKNVTLEGVGEDATLHGWGLTFKRACNIEVRNLGIMWYGGVGGDGDSLSLDTENKNIWMHNNDFFYGAPGKDSDQVKGDGSIDLKSKSDYITISYNHFWDSGKSCVSGGVWESKNPNDPGAKIFITYHHNWFDHSDSRHPRCVAGSTHVYNNYYDGVAKYGIGAAVQSSVFAEKNYFRNCPRPMLIATQGSDCYDAASGQYTNKGTLSGQTGGMIKEFDNIIIGAKRFYTYQTTPDTGEFDAYTVTSRDEQVPSTVTAKVGGSAYNNFDTSADMYAYTPDSPEDAVNKVTKYAGRINGGDFKYVFDNAVQDTNSDIIPELQQAIINYTSSLVSVPAIPNTPAQEPTQDPNSTSSPEPTKKPIAPVGSNLSHNFTTDRLNSSFITFGDTCSVKSGKDIVSYNGLTLTECLEIGSSTVFSFTSPKNGKCTFVYSTAKAVTAKINNTKVSGDTSTGLLTFDLEADKEYTITKADNAFLFYIDFAFEAGEEPSPVPQPANYIYEIEGCGFDANGKLNIDINYSGDGGDNAKLIAAVYSDAGLSVLTEIKTFDILGADIINLDFDKPESGTIQLYIWSDFEGLNPLSKVSTITEL